MEDPSKLGFSLRQCGLCYTTQGNLPQCSTCKATLYCSNHHQVEILPAHEMWCKDAVKARNELQCVLGNSPVKFMTNGSPFVLTEDQRRPLPTTPDHIHSHQLCSKVLDDIKACVVAHDPVYHGWEPNRLRRRDDNKSIWTIPYGILQVDRDDECHDLIEWHSTVSEDCKSYWDRIHCHWTKRPYRKDNRHVPFLEDRWCNILKSVIYLHIPLACSIHHRASHEVAKFIFAVHLKIKILLDLTGLHLCNTSQELLPHHIAPEIVDQIRYYIVESPLVTKNKLIMNNEADLGPLITELTMQLKALNRAMRRAKYWFWPILLAQIARINGRWDRWPIEGRPAPSGMEELRIEGYCYGASREMDSVPGLFDDIAQEIAGCMIQQGIALRPESTVESA